MEKAVRDTTDEFVLLLFRRGDNRSVLYWVKRGDAVTFTDQTICQNFFSLYPRFTVSVDGAAALV